MSNIQAELTTVKIPKKPSENTKLINQFYPYLYHWPLFLLALLLFLPMAYLYLSSTSPSYEIKASVILKDNKNAQEMKESALHEIDLINSSKIVENEIEILKSRQLITQVITDLRLWLNYSYQDGFRKVDLYGRSPILFVPSSTSFKHNATALSLKIKNDKEYELINSDGTASVLVFGKEYRNTFGKWKIQPTGFFNDFVGKTIIITFSDVESLAIIYQKLIGATLTNKLSTAVVLTLSDAVAQRGKDILNSLILNYNQQESRDKNENVENTLAFLDQRIQALATELGSTDNEIEGFKRSKGLTDINMQTQVSLENLQTNDSKLSEANIQLDIIRGIEEYINMASNSAKVPSTNGISDAALNKAIDKLAILQLQYEELSAKMPESNPEFEPINNQIRSTKGTIKEIVKNIRISLTRTRDKLRADNSKFESSIKDIPGQERKYVDIKRDQASKESLYAYYLQKRQEAGANYTLTLKEEKVIDQAYAGPSKSGKASAYGLALFLAILFPTGIIFTRNNFSSKILNVNEIESSLNVPVIIELPREQNSKIHDIKERVPTATTEQIRALRTKIQHFHQGKEGGLVTLITSSDSGEGKSFLSSQLAVAFAYSDRKTILLELDMRKPKISELFNLNRNDAGLSDYFLGHKTLAEVVQHSNILSHLDVVTSGRQITNPSELLAGDGLRKLIIELRKMYDYIIIDSPPSHLVPDAMIISPMTDICLYLIRQGYTGTNELDFINDLVEQNELKNVNIVFNGIEVKRFGYGYKHNKSYYNNRTSTVFENFFMDFRNRF